MTQFYAPIGTHHVESLVQLWGFGGTGSCSWDLLLGSGLAGGLSTSLSGSVVLTSRKPWFAPLPRPEEAAFPMVGAWVRVGRGVEADTGDLHWSPKFGWSNLYTGTRGEQRKNPSFPA